MSDLITAASADATRVETAAKGVVMTGFADAHAYAQHIATLVKSDTQKVETSHTALVILGMIVGAVLGALAMYAFVALR